MLGCLGVAAALAGPPEGWTDLGAAGVRVDARYATTANFTGAPLPGYDVGAAWLRAPVAEALLRVQAALAPTHAALLVYDAYRPARASVAMVDWARRTGNLWVVDQGYVAPKSQHNKGTTVDLTLVDLPTGQPVDMGSAWDEFSPASHTDNATGAALVQRHRLRDAMVAEGFVPYAKEWWHFGYKLDGAEPIDLPYTP